MSDALKPLVDEVVRRVLAELGKQPANDEAYLSTAKAAELASVTQGTIRRWVKAGKLTRYGKGQRVRVLKSEVEAMMRATENETLSPEELARRRSRLGF